MSDQDPGTEDGTTEAPAAGDAADKAVTQPSDEVTKLRSRNAGLDAKVTELSTATKTAVRERDEALAKLSDYEAGKVGADEALRAQLDAVKAEAAQARQEALLARIEAKYPETYAVLGEAAASLSVDKLAEAEARFAGVAAPEPTAAAPKPQPIANNQSRAGATAGEEDSSSIFEKLKGTPLPWA